MFEFDPTESRANKRKHGIDFVEPQELWLDPHRLLVPARTEDEPRFPLIGLIAGKAWSAIYSERGDRVRIISVRRSRKEKVERYEGA
jgi:uncharacterized DUF497 family protein